METPTSAIEVWPVHIIKELLPKDGILVNHADQAPAPSKDFAQIQLSLEEVIFRFWRISLRKNGSSLPMEKRESHDDFLYDERLQSEVHRLFGSNMLVYVRGLASGHIDYLVRLPQSILINMILHLELEDILNLAQTNKMFNQLCNSNDLWEKIYKNHTRQKISLELHSLAMAIGWRKLFFTNKIQLQVQLRRQAATRKIKREAAAREVAAPPMVKTLPAAAVEENKEERPEVAKEKKPKISPYPEGQTKPQFKEGPEDYRIYTLFDPRDANGKIDIESPSDEEEIVDEEAEEEELRRLQKQEEFNAVTFEDWGEDFSFLS